jgi:hypothetical protein
MFFLCFFTSFSNGLFGGISYALYVFMSFSNFWNGWWFEELIDLELINHNFICSAHIRLFVIRLLPSSLLRCASICTLELKKANISSQLSKKDIKKTRHRGQSLYDIGRNVNCTMVNCSIIAFWQPHQPTAEPLACSWVNWNDCLVELGSVQTISDQLFKPPHVWRNSTHA